MYFPVILSMACKVAYLVCCTLINYSPPSMIPHVNIYVQNLSVSSTVYSSSSIIALLSYLLFLCCTNLEIKVKKCFTYSWIEGAAEAYASAPGRPSSSLSDPALLTSAPAKAAFNPLVHMHRLCLFCSMVPFGFKLLMK